MNASTVHPALRPWVPMKCRDRYGEGYRIGLRGLGLRSAETYVYADREAARVQADIRNRIEGRAER